VWTPFWLRWWERRRWEPPVEGSADDVIPPDVFAQMPLTQTRTVQSLRYLSDPLPRDLVVAGPSVLHLHAAIDGDDTNWFVALKDVGPSDPLTVREGERELSPHTPERELTRGWLKASNRAVDPERSTPERPFHLLTRAAAAPVVPGEVTEYAIELLPTANLFRAGHRICVEISSMDVPTGVGGATNAEYVPYHVCSSQTRLHTVYHDPSRPSHLLLPVLAEEAQ
jgi:putative CocE/NonD family hydrolase